MPKNAKDLVVHFLNFDSRLEQSICKVYKQMAQNSLKMYLSFQVAIDGNKQNVGNNSGRMVSDPSH
jgi:hypothetical protein